MTIQQPTDFVLKAYTTEALAREGDVSKALRINDPDDEEGSIVNNPSQDGSEDYSGFFAFQRYWYRIESNEPVSEFYIDWDDGEDNSPEKANITIIKNNKPTFVGVTSHIYTQSRKFYPLIRVKSIEGFLSKWYTPHASDGDSSVSSGYNLAGLDDDIKLTGSSGQLFDKGQNEFSVVSIEKNDDTTDYARIPIFEPANVPPIGVLKTDRKKVFSGIDNTWLGNNDRLLYGLDSSVLLYTSTIHAVCSNQNRTAVPVKVTYQEGVLGGVSAVSEITTKPYGTYNDAGTRGFNIADLEDKVIYIRSADETYGCYFTWTSGGQTANSSPPTMEVAGAIPVSVVIESGGTTSALYLIASELGTYLAAKLNTILYQGRREFTSVATSGHETRFVVTTTHRNQAPVTQTSIGSTGTTDLLFEDEDEDVGSPNYYEPRFTTTGVSPSDGTIKQKTIVTDVNTSGVYDSSAKIQNVAKVLRIELTNNKESLDTPHTGSAETNVLAPEERVFIQSSISYSSATANPSATVRESLKNISGTVGFVSLGNPIMELDSLGSFLTVDATESKIRTSNKSVSAYYIDDNKLVSGDNSTFTVDTASYNNTKTVTHSTFTVGTASYNDTKTVTHATSTLIKVGQSVSGAGIPAGAYVAIVTDSTHFELSIAATDGSKSGETLTFATSIMYGINISVIKVGQSVSGAGIPTGAYVAIVTDSTHFELSIAATGGSQSDETLTFNANVTQNQKTDYDYNITDIIVDGQDFKNTEGVRDLRYCFDWWRDFQDANYRFFPQKRLIRCQVEDNHTQVANDGYNRSPISHWDSSGYISTGIGGDTSADAVGLPSDISKYNYGALLFTNKAKLRSPEWFNISIANRGDNNVLFGSNANEEYTLLCSTAYDDISTAAHYDADNISAAHGVGAGGQVQTDTDTVGPRNAIFMTQKEKFDRIFVRVNHDRLQAAGMIMPNMSTRVDNTPTENNLPAVRIQVLYPSKKTRNSSTIIWKPLKVVDRTRLKGKDNSSFYLSGDISFLPPSDWEKTKHSDSVVYPYEDNFFMDKGVMDQSSLVTTDGIDDHWTEDSYALIFLITHIDSGSSSIGDGGGRETVKNIFSVISMHPFNNSHSQLIEMTDPMHISLNKYGIAQSVSYTRKGKYQEIKDRSGLSSMRRIGADGGQIKLGSIDLKSDPHSTRAKFHEFQQDAIPVYYDVKHNDDSITRLFGVLTDMSEDFPTAGVIPKFACNMKVTHTLEISSSGVIQDDGYVPLGGDVIDVGQYLSAV